MIADKANLAEAYYTAMAEKDIASLEKYLHPEVRFIAPLAQLEGKEAILEATRKFTSLFEALAVRAVFGSGDQGMVVYDLVLPEPLKNMSSAALLTFQDELIVKIELFYDARPFEKK